MWSAGLALWVASLAVASPWDLTVSAAVVDRASTFGQLVASFGEWPAWAVALVSLITVVVGRRRPGWSPLIPLAWAILLLAIVHPLIITQTLKLLWGRIRFRNLGSDFAGFTPFYLPAGIGAGPSFPSGHVAMAFVPCPAVFGLWRAYGPRYGLIALLVVSVYGIGVAWGRMVAGAHYPTDCLFSAGLPFLLAPVLVRWTTGRFSADPTVCPLDN